MAKEFYDVLKEALIEEAEDLYDQDSDRFLGVRAALGDVGSGPNWNVIETAVGITLLVGASFNPRILGTNEPDPDQVDKTVFSVMLQGVVNILGAHRSTSNPTNLNDENGGWCPGRLWLNTDTKTLWVCVSAAPLLAVWESVGGGPIGAVDSVFGRTGAVVAQNGDYTAGQVGADPAGTATAAIAAHEAAGNPHPTYTTDAEATAIAAGEVATAIATHEAAGNPHPTYTTNAEATTLAAAEVTAHVGLADPHTQYQKESEKGAVNGYAELDAGGKLPTTQLPTHASTHKSGGTDPIRLDELAAPTSSVSFNDQQATSFRVENRTSDPGAPTVGQIWLRTDL